MQRLKSVTERYYKNTTNFSLSIKRILYFCINLVANFNRYIMKHLIITLFSLMFCTTLLAYDVEIDGIYYNFSGDEAEVTYQQRVGENQFPMSDYSGSIVLPESVVYKEKSYKVTRIGQQAFFCCEDVISITIPKSVNVIRHYAFAGCSNLTEIVCKAHNPPATRYIDKVGFDRLGGVFYGVDKQNSNYMFPKVVKRLTEPQNYGRTSISWKWKWELMK